MPAALPTVTATRYVTPLGHIWVIGGGYVDGLVNSIVVTSKPYGWRDEPTTKAALSDDPKRRNLYAAVTERTVAIGYEAVIAAAQIAP